MQEIDFRNVVVFSDGGARIDCSASAWALGVCTTSSHSPHFEPLIIEGIFFADPLNSFQGEAIALEMASKELVKWCNSF